MNYHPFNTNRGDRAYQAAMPDCVVSLDGTSPRGISENSRAN